MNKLKFLFKILKEYNKYQNKLKKQGYTINDIDFIFDPFACHLKMLCIVKEFAPNGLIKLDDNWREKGR
ncbi:hypothetical protein LCGC14_1620470 [marine sediment metagenome]|uniref:Uncharacterized protein n=1 Tax=marine sediment metagenome TaxID=412755 RepID=A0A0F9L5K2_9ZZZZ|nr:hypothetical protein [bacterium]